MNSWVIQNEACISTAKLEHLSFSGRHVQIIFENYFTENKIRVSKEVVTWCFTPCQLLQLYQGKN